ncbi:hypothetical protein MJO28_005673 [Puccinia striiformis f. sp. tritici]|uniref:Uncharacterized protein n=1 Tax=Puccinia striiformis f. sp. tritici TaxID=168172 RepID=A0ACC0EN95_9BASI|nr:hypothetical protein MJO28_005673 [Puccinia striiformis f. sp. tritici]
MTEFKSKSNEYFSDSSFYSFGYPYFKPVQHIDCLSQQFYPEKEEMFLHTPLEFHEVASSVMAQLGFHFLRIGFGNVWIVFHHMLPYVQEQYVPYTDSSDA